MAYATYGNLVAWYDNDAPPPNAERLLARAEELLDELLIGAVYEVNDAGLPADAGVVNALMRATCAQVQYMDAAKDETGGLSAFTSVSVGGVSYSRNVSAGGSALSAVPRFAPHAISILRVAQLLPVSALAW